MQSLPLTGLLLSLRWVRCSNHYVLWQVQVDSSFCHRTSMAILLEPLHAERLSSAVERKVPIPIMFAP